MAEQSKTTEIMQGRRAVVETTPVVLQLSEQAIETTKHNIQLCEQLVQEVLERDIDFGTIPGVPQPFLWDSGAAKIMAAFNCYAEYKVIDSVIQVPHIRYTITCNLINRQSQQIVATGIGAAYTKEVKHRYRWVINPEKEGISRKGLKQNKYGKYRIPNPDTEDLLNTIAKMAAKRADVDATQSLPGVAATLRKIFKGAPLRRPPLETGEQQGSELLDKHSWRWFESKLATLGVTHSEARDFLSVHSINDDWIGVQGKTLDEAYDIIKAAVTLGTPPGEQMHTKSDNVVDGKTGEITTPEKEILAAEETPATKIEEELFGEGEEPEIPLVDEELLKGWEIVRDAVQQLNLTDSQVRNYFAHYHIEIGLADFARALPPTTMTNDMLSKFQVMLDTYREKQEQTEE